MICTTGVRGEDEQDDFWDVLFDTVGNLPASEMTIVDADLKLSGHVGAKW